MKLSDGEKLIVVMLSDIYKHLKIDGEIDAGFVSHAIFYDHLWSIPWQMTGLFPNADRPPAEVIETSDFLDMWTFIEESYENLAAADKAAVDAASGGKYATVFIGFDGNHEPHYGIARQFINQMKSFQRFKGRDINSHSPQIDKYRRMYRVFDPLRPNLGGGRWLTVAELNSILAA